MEYTGKALPYLCTVNQTHSVTRHASERGERVAKEINNFNNQSFKNISIMSKVKNGTIYYQVYQNVNKNSENYKKWYARAKHTETVSFEELIEHMTSHNIGFPRGIVQGVMMSFVDCLLELVAESKKVQLGDLGTFYLNISSKPAEKYEDFNANENIEGCGLRFIASQTTSKNDLSRAAFSSVISYRNFNSLLAASDKKVVDSHNNEQNKE